MERISMRRIISVFLTVLMLILVIYPCTVKAAGANDKKEQGTEKNGDVYILFTSDVHCGVSKGFGYTGLYEIRKNLEEQGYETILVDDGDSIQGEAMGTITDGEAIVDLMNDLQYDVAIPGNHEFDYGMDTFLNLANKKAKFKYISCNFNKDGELIFDPYTIIEAAGMKIAFVGVTTPETITTSTPAYFQDNKGNYIYGFMGDKTGEGVYKAIQEAVDAARKEGADFVYVMGHLGNQDICEPWTYADVIENTNGIDVFLDGHSHDTDQIVMKNKDGDEVTRAAVGTKLNCIGYSHISADKEIVETDVWSWPNSESAPKLLNIENDMADKVAKKEDELENTLKKVVAKISIELTIFDPKEKDDSGNPIRMVRRAETNLGDLCADACRDQTGADIAFVNGGGIRAVIEKGNITYEDIINVHPYGNMVSVLELSGQQILDALEWGARSVPDESGGFLQVSGLTYELDASVKNPCTEDENSMCTGIKGNRRVKNVKVDGKDIDPKKTYTVAGNEYLMQQNGDGFTAFDGAKVVQDRIKLDNQVLIDYIVDTLGGSVGEEYADPFGEGRITITE